MVPSSPNWQTHAEAWTASALSAALVGVRNLLWHFPILRQDATDLAIDSTRDAERILTDLQPVPDAFITLREVQRDAIILARRFAIARGFQLPRVVELASELPVIFRQVLRRCYIARYSLREMGRFLQIDGQRETRDRIKRYFLVWHNLLIERGWGNDDYTFPQPEQMTALDHPDEPLV